MSRDTYSPFSLCPCLCAFSLFLSLPLSPSLSVPRWQIWVIWDGKKKEKERVPPSSLLVVLIRGGRWIWSWSRGGRRQPSSSSSSYHHHHHRWSRGGGRSKAGLRCVDFNGRLSLHSSSSSSSSSSSPSFICYLHFCPSSFLSFISIYKTSPPNSSKIFLSLFLVQSFEWTLYLMIYPHAHLLLHVLVMCCGQT